MKFVVPMGSHWLNNHTMRRRWCKHARCLRRKSKPSPGFRLRIRTLLTSLQVKEISKRETLFPAALNQTHPRVGEIKRSIKARELRVRGRPLSRGGMSPDVHNFDPVSAASLQRWYDLSHARRHRKFVGISTHRPLDRSRVSPIQCSMGFRMYRFSNFEPGNIPSTYSHDP